MNKVKAGQIDPRLKALGVESLKKGGDNPVEVVPELQVGLNPSAGHKAGMEIPEHTQSKGSAKRHELAFRFPHIGAEKVRKRMLKIIHPSGKMTGTIGSALDRLSRQKPDDVNETASRVRSHVAEHTERPLEHLHREVVGPIVEYVDKYADPKNFVTKNPLMALVHTATKGSRDDRFATAAKIAVAGLEGIQERDPPAKEQLATLNKLSRALSTGFLAHEEIRPQIQGLGNRVETLTTDIWQREANKAGAEAIDEIANTTPTSYAQLSELRGLLDARVRSLQFGDRKFPSHGREVSGIILRASEGLHPALRDKAMELVGSERFLNEAPHDDLQSLWKDMVDLESLLPSAEYQDSKAKLAEALVNRSSPLSKDAGLFDIHTRVSWLASLAEAVPEKASVQKTIASQVATLAARAAVPSQPGPSDDRHEASRAVRRFVELSDIAAQLPDKHPTLAKVNTARLQDADVVLDVLLEGISEASDDRGARWSIGHLESLQEVLNPTLDAAGRQALQARIDEAHGQHKTNKEGKAVAAQKARSSSFEPSTTRKRTPETGMSMEMKVALMGAAGM